ncbi:hypothetical protein Tco_1129625 [Tanacetum coccineum]
MVDDAWEKNPEMVKNEFKSYFSEKFSPFVRSRPRMEFEFSRGLSTEQSAELEVVFSKVEIKEAVRGCSSDKSPGPDGFTFDFSKDIGVVDPVFIKDYRPISLIGSFYKIVGKVIANRIASVVEDLINFEKAYDSVCWDYLQDVMFKMGFGRKWCAWIKGCLESSVTSILVNGSPTDEFKIRRGLRKGVPFYFGNGVSPYVDISCYSFLSIAWSSNWLMGVGVPIGKINEMANIIGCEASTIPFVYLEVSVGANMTRIESWKELIDKFKTRLSR